MVGSLITHDHDDKTTLIELDLLRNALDIVPVVSSIGGMSHFLDRRSPLIHSFRNLTNQRRSEHQQGIRQGEKARSFEEQEQGSLRDHRP